MATAAQAGKSEDEAKKIQKDIDAKKKQIEDARKRADEFTKRPVQIQQPRSGKMVAAQPLDRSRIEVKPSEDPRKALVDWMTGPSNEYFAGSMVNRLWKHFLGVGLVEPVDDLRASNPPSNQPLWQALNAEFVGHNFDVVRSAVRKKDRYTSRADFVCANQCGADDRYEPNAQRHADNRSTPRQGTHRLDHVHGHEVTLFGVDTRQLEGERCPKARPFSVAASRGRNHVHRFDQPHPALW